MFKKVFLASRPKTLVAAFSPVFLGAAFAYRAQGQISFINFYTILFVSFCIQVATNFFNDALDSEKGRDSKSERLGPERFSGSDPAFKSLLKKLGFSLLFLSFLCGVYLSFVSSLWVLAAGLPALVLAYVYTGTDYSLSENGWADAFVVLYFGVFPVSLSAFVLGGGFDFKSAFAGLQVGLICNALLLINNLRDEGEDKKTGKRTLIVKYGRAFGLKLLAFCLFAPYLMHFYWFLVEPLFFRSALWTAPLLVLAAVLFLQVKKQKPSPLYNRYLALSSLHLFVYAVMFSIGVLSS